MPTSKLLLRLALLALLTSPVVARAAEGDVALMKNVAAYTREALDRGGWVNPYLPAAAAGNPLAMVRIREGVTLTSEEEGSAGREPARKSRR
jgi:hypothetical protein